MKAKMAVGEGLVGATEDAPNRINNYLQSGNPDICNG